MIKMRKQMNRISRLFIEGIVLLGIFSSICFFSCTKKSDSLKNNSSSGIIELKSHNPENGEKAAETVPPAEEKPEKTADNNRVDMNALPSPAAQDPKPAPAVESVVPEQIRRPQRGESPRLPEDTIIGPLGRGEAPPEAYRFAQRTLQSLMRTPPAPDILAGLDPGEAGRITGILLEIKPAQVRIGGGRTEEDGSVSFLLRFIGSSQWAGGELYVRLKETTWVLEDLILDRPGNSSGMEDPYRFNLPPYERFL